jgi:peptide/nickel transport system permease protein
VKVFYTTGLTSVGGGGLLDRVQHLTLPVLTLGIANIASWSRYQRASMLDVIHSDYLRTARAKGLPMRLVIFKHALRNALIPVVTVVALDMSTLVGGAVVTETIFAIPGMGRLIYLAISERDYPVVMAGIMVVSMAVVFFNLVADILYAFLDPRIRYE